MNLFTLTGEILLKGADEAKRDINEVGDSAEKSESRMMGAFKKIGAAVAGAFAIDKIKDFGVSIVNASAEVGAEMSAFEQIMGDYSDNAQKKLNEVADQTGVVSTRLTPYMTSLTAKFKGLGNDIVTSTDMAQRGLLLASDASAFWDKSLDDSMSALNSFINGSYEGGEAIGLFANDTQMAAYAVKKGIVESTKEWANLDEATKQATRLEYAEAMMEQSGATGQAAKESGQYANVQANLAEAWRQFKAEIGEPLLQNVVIPAMKALQDVVGTMSEKWKQLQGWIADNREEIDRWVDILIIAGTMIGAYVLVAGTMSILKSVGTWIKAVATAQKAMNLVMAANPIALVVAAIAGLVIAFIKAYNESETFRNIVNGVATAVKNAWLAMVDWFKGLPETFKKLWEDVKTWTVNTWNSIKTSVTGIWNSFKTSVVNITISFITVMKTKFNEFKTALSNIWTAVKNTASNIWNSIKTTVVGIWNAFKTSIVNITTSLVTAIKTKFNEFKTALSNIWNAIKTTASNLWNSIKTTVTNIATSLVNGVKGKFESFKTAVSNIWTSIKNTASNIWNGLKTSVTNIASNLVSGITGKFNSFKSTVSTIWNGVKTGIVNAIKELPSKMLSIGSDIVKGLWNGINDMTGWIVGKVKGFGDNVLSGIKNFFGIKSPSRVFAEIGKFLAEGLGMGIEENSDTAVEAVEGTGKDIASTLQNFMDKLGDKFTSNPVLRRIGEAFGFEYAEGIEESIPEIESAAVEVGETVPEMVAETVEENIPVAKKAFGDMFREMAESAYTYTEKAMGYLSGVGDAIREYQNQQLENEIATKEAEIDALNKATDEKLETAEAEHDEKLALLKDEFNKGLIDETAYNAAKEKLAKELSEKTKAIQTDAAEHEKKLAKEKDDLQRRQFEAKKKSEIANVWVNFASATMRAFAENWWPIALGITTALATQAGLQTATIQSQQYAPAMAKGGIVDRATYGLVGEDGREAVVPLENNTEWVGGLARAISPAVAASSSSNTEEIRTLREEIVGIRMMLAEYLEKLVEKDTDIVINGESLAYAIAPAIDTRLGNINRLRERGV